MTRKRLVLAVAVALLVLVVAGCAPAAPPAPSPAPAPAPAPVVKPPVVKPPVVKPPVEKIAWKIAGYSPPGHPVTVALEQLYDEIAKRSQGRFEPSYYFGAVLAHGKEQPEGLKVGLFQAVSVCPAYHPAKTPLSVLTYLPCLFPLYTDSKVEWLTFARLIQEWGQTPLMAKEYAKWGGMLIDEQYPFSYTLMGSLSITNMEQLKGKKIRAIGGIATLLTTAGAATVFTTAPEMYDALSKGVIEAAAHCHISFLAYGLDEVSKYYVAKNLNLGNMPFYHLARIEDYDRLPEDLQEIFQEVVKDWWPSVRVNYWDTKKQEALDAFKKEGVEFVTFTAGDMAKLREMAIPIWKESVDKLEKEGLPGREAFNSLQDIMKKHIFGYEPYHL